MCWPKCSQRNCRMKKAKGTFKCSSDLQHSNTCLPSVSLSQDVCALKKHRWEHPTLHYSERVVFTYWPWHSSCQNISLAALRPILPHWVHPSGKDSHSLQLHQPSLCLWCPFPSVSVSSHTPDHPALSKTLDPRQHWLLLASAPAWYDRTLETFPRELLCPHSIIPVSSLWLGSFSVHDWQCVRAAHCPAATQAGVLPSPSAEIAALQRQLHGFL